MAKKRGESHGGSRGGRGRGGGRGGRFFLSKTQKRKARKSKNKGDGRDIPELMDLNHDEYVPEKGTETPKRSMKDLANRPQKRMIDEARYTDRHIEKTMREPLRKRGVEFVKAKEVYDPSKDLIERIINYNKENKSLSEHMESLRVEEPQSEDDLAQNLESQHTREDPSEPEQSQNLETDDSSRDDIVKCFDLIDEDEMVGDEQPIQEEEETTDNVIVDEETEDGQVIQDDQVIQKDGFEEDDDIQEEDGLRENENIQEDEDIQEDKAVAGDVLQGNMNEDKNNEEDEEFINESDYKRSADFYEVEDIAAKDVQIGLADNGTTSESHSDEHDLDEEDMYIIDEEGDDNVLMSHGVRKKQFYEVISQRPQRKELEIVEAQTIEQPKAFLEHDPHITVGHVMLTTKMENGTVEASLPTLNHLDNVTTRGFVELAADRNEYSSDDSNEEAAFEDYMSQVMEANNMSYSNDEYSSDEGFESQDNIEDEISLNSDEEGLEEIVAFARKQKSFSDLDIPATQTLKKKGKGKKQTLQLLDDLEMELRESLLEQFRYQKRSRRDKKLAQKERRKQIALVNSDLSVKYDYSIHIEEIKEEFDVFLQDNSRDTMSFPPLDAHGNKTINKLAHLYNMRCTRNCGNGLTMYMKVSKNRKTYHHLPDFNLISYIMRQRPIFKRLDVKSRTKEEIASTDGKSLRRGPKNNAHVKEGDIVGEKAPEIDSNNIGRQLLEKLGWVKGEGLGAHGNKGISEPLMATVKKSRTGLK